MLKHLLAVALNGISPVQHMDNLSNITNQRKQQYEIDAYMTEVEYDLVRAELDEAANPFLPFMPKETKSKYLHRGGSKAGNTELRIAGVILNMVRASSNRDQLSKVRFNKATIARQVSNNGEAISERTVQRYLSIVLNNLAEAYNLHFEVIMGHKGGVMIWTDELEQIIKSHGDLFDASLVSKVRRKGDRSRVEAWKRSRTKRATSERMAKAKKINKAGVPPAMMRLASNLLRTATIPHLNRFEASSDLIKAMIATRLTQGAWRTTAVKEVCEALRVTDSAMSDFHIGNPPAYAWGVLKSKETKRETASQIKAKVNQFWESQLALNKTLFDQAKSSDDTLGQEALTSMIKRCESKVA